MLSGTKQTNFQIEKTNASPLINKTPKEKEEKPKTLFDCIDKMVYPREPLSYSPEVIFNYAIATQPALFNLKRQGLTPLLYAAAMGRSIAVFLLLKSGLGIDIDEMDSVGNSALELAVREGGPDAADIVKLLLEHGAYVSDRMIGIARSKKLEVIAEMLETHFASFSEAEKKMRIAIREGDKTAMKKLFDEGFPIDRMDSSKTSLFMLAIFEAPTQKIVVFLKRLAAVFSITPLSSDVEIQHCKKLLAEFPTVGYWRTYDGMTLFDLQPALLSSLALKANVQANGTQLKYDDKTRSQILKIMGPGEVQSMPEIKVDDARMTTAKCMEILKDDAPSVRVLETPKLPMPTPGSLKLDVQQMKISDSLLGKRAWERVAGEVTFTPDDASSSDEEVEKFSHKRYRPGYKAVT